ncbi:unnamed protein product [Zymoseptoria tritici ST99CH_3D1]|nr:unnamed protein product [Zymoseptoria tritici ST99CH_3D1]
MIVIDDDVNSDSSLQDIIVKARVAAARRAKEKAAESAELLVQTPVKTMASLTSSGAANMTAKAPSIKKLDKLKKVRELLHAPNLTLLQERSELLSGLPDIPLKQEWKGFKVEPVVDEPIAAVDEHVNKPVVNEPVVNEPVVNEPVVNEPVVNEPVVEQSNGPRRSGRKRILTQKRAESES